MTDDAQEVPALADSGDAKVPEKAQRRRFEPAYRLWISPEADRASDPSAVGELLRGEGLYLSYLTSWRR